MAIARIESYKYVGSAALKGGEVLKLGSNQGECDVATAATDFPIGVAAHGVTAGNVTAQNLGVFMPGQVVKMIGSTTISLGARLAATTGGKVVTAAAKSATGNTTVSYDLGRALEAAGSGGTDLIAVHFWPTEVNV